MGSKEKVIGDRGQFPLETGDLWLNEGNHFSSFILLSERSLSTHIVCSSC